MENTKDEADAGSFGMLVKFHSEEGVQTSKLASLMDDVLLNVAEEIVKEKRHLMGHIKAFVTVPDGTLKLNIIDLDLGVESVNHIKGDIVRSGEMRFMAAIVGLHDEDLEEIMEESVELLKPSFEVEIEGHEHDEHEHEHEGHHHHC